MNDKDEKQEGLVQRRLKSKGAVGRSLRNAKDNIDFTKSAGNEFGRRFKNMFVVRRQTPAVNDLAIFENLLQFWGINEGDLHKVKKNMRASNYAVFFMIIIAFIGLVQTTGLYYYCLLSALIVGGIIKIVMTIWQLWVLKRRQYVSFKNWFTLNYK